MNDKVIWENTKLRNHPIFWEFLFSLSFLVVMSVLLNASPFDINEFSNPYKYGWSDEDSRLNARDSLFLKTMMLDDYNSQKQSPIANAFKTALVPGWGHFSVRRYTKGQVFLGSQVILFGSGLYYREKAMIEYNKYEKATQIEDMTKYYDNAIIPYRQSSLLFTLYFIVWGYTIYDVIIETNSYNWELWDKISNVTVGSNLIITPTSISYRFR